MLAVKGNISFKKCWRWFLKSLWDEENRYTSPEVPQLPPGCGALDGFSEMTTSQSHELPYNCLRNSETFMTRSLFGWEFDPMGVGR